jgi:type III secretion system YscQ/HrcQ family protein
MPPLELDNDVEEPLPDDFPNRNEQVDGAEYPESDELNEDGFEDDGFDDEDESSEEEDDDGGADDGIETGDAGPENEATDLSVALSETGKVRLADSVHLTLTFDVGETQMSLQQLRSLLPGYTFELDTRVESPVAIKAYGQSIGRGSLVQIDERLGVRLLEVNRDGR